jgi:peptidoglycan/LPS O-acetylase OafA/YrhL
MTDNSADSILFRIVRRLVAPALLAGVLSNFAIYRMLGSDESPFRDWKSMAMMTSIALVGMLVGGFPALAMLNRARVPGVVRVAAFIVAGIVTGGAIALTIACLIVDEGQLGYVKYGLAAGLVGGLVWLIFNMDLARRPGNGSIS